MSKESNKVFAQLALKDFAIAGLLEDLGYGPWRDANKAAHTKLQPKKRKNLVKKG